MTTENIWIVLGMMGQLIFTARFLVQWLSSERAGRSVVPVSFWYLSIGGSVLLLAYAGYRRDPVFILGQTSGMFIYLRNLQLIGRQTHQEQQHSDEPAPQGSAPALRLHTADEKSARAPSESTERRAA
jgi:lipid-A-disaccharide synthase-like uncharacterized protein